MNDDGEMGQDNINGVEDVSFEETSVDDAVNRQEAQDDEDQEAEDGSAIDRAFDEL